MIKLFRNIRRSLLNEGKTSAYFKYAIGEIVLVVIGILIALQINNWNEINKAKAYEKNTLKEIQKTLKADLVFFGLLKERIRIKDTAIDDLLLVRKGKLNLTDEELTRSIRQAHFGLIFSYNPAPYEALKSSGLDKIKTDSLRTALTKYYEVYIPRAEAFLKSTEEKYGPLITAEDNRLKEQGFYSYYFESKVDKNGKEGFRPRSNYNLEKYIKDPSYNEVLLLESNYKVSIWGTLINIIARTEELEEIVNLELQTRFNE